MEIIKGHQIEDIQTKFYYKSHNLCYEIQLLLNENSDQVIVFANYSDYNEYKEAFAQLQLARAKNSEIKVPVLTSNYDSPPARQTAS